MVLDYIVFRMTAQGADGRGMVRWSNNNLTGKKKLHNYFYLLLPLSRNLTRFYLLSAADLYVKHNIDILQSMACPGQLFGLDLKIDIELCLNQGHQVIVQGNFNSDNRALI